MDNPLTPKKIQKLINLAEGRSFVEKLLMTEEDLKRMRAVPQSQTNMSSARYESSSGILDLDQLEAFGESGSMGNLSLSKSTTFNPGEMTGRSTGAEEKPKTLEVPVTQYGSHSIDLDSIISEMDKQTNEINEIMRHSIATNTNYSFHSKRDLTADEASLIVREAPLPILQTTQTMFQDSVLTNTSNVSVGTYFKNRCVDFQKILGKTDSPDRSMMPSITEVSSSAIYDQHQKDSNIDDTLDSVPVRQPRNTDVTKPGLQSEPAMIQKSLFKEPAMPRTEKPNVKVPEKTSLHPTTIPHKAFLSSSKPTDVLLKNLQASFKVVADETEGSIENSLSLSKIADYLGNQSNVSVSDMMQLNQRRPALKKQPLTEIQMNSIQETPVAYLVDSKMTETASSAGTATTVISLDKLKIQEDKVQNPAPKVVITQTKASNEEDKRITRSKSPSTRSPSSLSTVRDNYSSFKSGDSPNTSKGEANRSKIPSPNIAYKELDKSVDWQEVLLQKRNRQRDLAKEHLVQIETTSVEGYVGVTTAITLSITTLSDSWLTAKFQFNSLPNDGKDLNVELPRLPILLSPGKSENLTLYVTSSVEMDAILPFTFLVKDTSLDRDVEESGELKVKFKIPIIQAMSADGMNKLTFPPIREKTSITKTFVLISECPADLQIKLFINEGEEFFYIKSVQEIRKSDVNKAIMERQASDDKTSRSKTKMQLCRITNSSAIRVGITFDAPKLAEVKNPTPKFNGALYVTLINGDTTLRKINLAGIVGVPELVIKSLQNIYKLSKEPIELTVVNMGLISGSWAVKHKSINNAPVPFAISPTKFTLAPNEAGSIRMMYTGPEDAVNELSIRFEETTTGASNEITLTGGNEKPKSFPIKSNHNSLSWVKPGRKEVSLKNNMDKKVHIRCHIVGEGFTIDLPGGEARGIYVLSFNACECRPLPILFAPTSGMPHVATLHLVYDRNSDFSRKIKLFGCAGGGPARWAGLVTLSECAALVRAAPRAAQTLRLRNAAPAPAFIAARATYNLQYTQVEPFSRLVGAFKVVPGRSYHTITLHLDWTKVEQRAREAGTTAFATVTVLTGAESTRRRILKIIKDESSGKLDPSQLPEPLRVLAREFEGEDDALNNSFDNFDEPKSALSELTGGVRELTAHIDLPQDFAEDNTIIISDDTVVEHHTLCD